MIDSPKFYPVRILRYMVTNLIIKYFEGTKIYFLDKMFNKVYFKFIMRDRILKRQFTEDFDLEAITFHLFDLRKNLHYMYSLSDLYNDFKICDCTCKNQPSSHKN